MRHSVYDAKLVSFDRDTLRIGFCGESRSRPLADFPALASASPRQRACYDILPDGIRWPELGFAIPKAVLDGDGWRHSIIAINTTKIFFTPEDRDLVQPRHLAHDGGETMAVLFGRDFVVMRGDTVLVRPIESYPTLAGRRRDDLAYYTIGADGLRFPRISDAVVVAFPPVCGDRFVLPWLTAPATLKPVTRPR